MLKIKKGFIIKNVAGTGVVVATGKASLKFNSIATLNETGIFLWHQLENGAEKDELIRALMRKYDIDEKTALSDVDAFIKIVKGAGMLE